MLPNHSITLNGLNERKILSWWERTSIWANPKLQGPPSHPWSSLGWNCAKIVATALSKGGGDSYSNWMHSWNVVWMPNDVRRYAASIKRGLR